MSYLILMAGLLLLIPAWLLRRGRWYRRGGAALFALTALITLFIGSYWFWFTHRAQPAEVREHWYDGVVYERIVLHTPRPMVAHIVTVDLNTPGLKLVFTSPPPMVTANVRFPMHAQTTSHFARDNNLQIAINGSFFYPFRAGNPLSYYPREGDNVQASGITAFQGIVYQRSRWVEATFYVAEDGTASFRTPEGPLYNAISGSAMLVDDARNIAPDDKENPLHSRTALALDRSRRTLILVVVDGKQPNYSEGCTLPELADLLIEHGAFTAINLDGGSSSTLVHQSAPAAWSVINAPCNFEVPGWERPVANHLGIQITPPK